MLEDTLEGMDDEEEMEEAAEAEVDKILFEITAGKDPKFLYIFFAFVLLDTKLVFTFLGGEGKEWGP